MIYLINSTVNGLLNRNCTGEKGEKEKKNNEYTRIRRRNVIIRAKKNDVHWKAAIFAVCAESLMYRNNKVSLQRLGYLIMRDALIYMLYIEANFTQTHAISMNVHVLFEFPFIFLIWISFQVLFMAFFLHMYVIHIYENTV